MSEDQQKRKRGRPVVGEPRNTRLPEVRVSEGELAAFRAAAKHSNKSFSDWVRNALKKDTKKL